MWFYTGTILLFFIITCNIHCEEEEEDVCTKVNEQIVYSVCDEQYAHVCCPLVFLHNGTLSRKQFAACDDLTDIACHGGFFGEGGQVLPCPPGYFCYHTWRCIIPCEQGYYCPGLSNVENSTKCRHPLTGAEVEAATINGRLQCRGENTYNPCPEGSYCPTTTEIYECPSGKYCPENTATPYRCNMFGTCSFDDPSLDDIVGVLLLILLAAICVLLMVLRCTMHGRSILIRQEKQDLVSANGTHYHTSFSLSNALWYSCKVDITGYKENLPDQRLKHTISTRGYTYETNNHRRLLRNVTATFPHSQLNVVMGPSGCGKSTLINAMMGRYNGRGSSSGGLYLNGTEIENLDVIRSTVGYVTQQDLMHPNLTVKEILTFQAQLRLSKSEGTIFFPFFLRMTSIIHPRIT